MSFGQKYVRNVEASQQKDIKELQRQMLEEAQDQPTKKENSSLPSGSVPSGPEVNRNARPSRFMRQKEELAAPVLSSQSLTPASTPTQLPSTKNVLSEPSTNADQYALIRARRLIVEIGEYKKWSIEDIQKCERRAERDPRAIIDELLPLYNQDVRPLKQKGVRSLEEALAQHPNDVVFLLAKGPAQKIRVMTLEEAGSQSVLHGSVLESVSVELTPFASPSILFPLTTKPEIQPDISADKKKSISP